MIKVFYLKSSSILDLLLFLSTLELWRDLAPVIREPKGMAPTPMAPIGPIEAPSVGCGLAAG